MSAFISFCIKIILGAAVFTGAFYWFISPPDYLFSPDETVSVPASSIRFYADATFVDDGGTRRTRQEIWDHLFALIDGAHQFLLLDFSLFNDFQGIHREETRILSSELMGHLIAQKKKNPKMPVSLITDPINDLYGGVVSPYFDFLEDAGVVLVRTDLSSLRDSNRFWTAIWRSFFSWWGNSPSGGWLVHPFSSDGKKVTLRTWANLLNFKANGRSLVVADGMYKKNNGALEQKMVTVITSANPQDAGSADGNVALEVQDALWQSVVNSERNVARLSATTLPSLTRGEIHDETGDIAVTLLRERYIKEKVLNILSTAKRGDSFELAMRYLSDRDIIRSLVSAANHGATIRVLLDPNIDVFPLQKIGIPNQPVAKELSHNSGGDISVRWCATNGEHCNTKLFIGKTSTSTFLLLGSANFTRRDLENFNLETSVIAESPTVFPAWNDAHAYFNQLWENKGGVYSADYAVYQDTSLWKTSLYRMMERTGLSSF